MLILAELTMSKKVKDYTLHVPPLGQGSFGTVYKATKEGTDQIFAAKQIPKQRIKQQKDLENIEREIAILQTVKHPNIVAMHPVIQTENNLYLIMDYCKDGDLQGLMNPHIGSGLGEEKALYYLKQIMSAMRELQLRRVIHRDIKPANILVHGQYLKLADFGYAKIAEQTSTRVGTPNYMAPEILFDNPNGHNFDAKVDLFSIGAVFYEMLFGKLLFSGNKLEMIREVMKSTLASGYLDTSKLTGISDTSKDLLRRLLAYAPDNRISWDEVFSHPVFSEGSEVIQDGTMEAVQKSADHGQMMVETPKLQKDHGFSVQPTPISFSAARLVPANLQVPKESEQLYIQSKLAHEDKVCKFWLKSAREGVMFLKNISPALAASSPYLTDLAATVSYISGLCLLNTRILHTEAVKLSVFDQRPEMRIATSQDWGMFRQASENFKLTLKNIFGSQMQTNQVLIETITRMQLVEEQLSKLQPEAISPELQRDFLSQVGSAQFKPSVTRALELFVQLRLQIPTLSGQLEPYFANLRYCMEQILHREGKYAKTIGCMTYLKDSIPDQTVVAFQPSIIFDWQAVETRFAAEKDSHLKVLESLLAIN